MSKSLNDVTCFILKRTMELAGIDRKQLISIINIFFLGVQQLQFLETISIEK